MRVRTPQVTALHDALTKRGIRAQLVADDALVALDSTPEALGLAAAGIGAVIYEMTPEHFNLEEIYLELTATEEALAMRNLISAELLKLRTTRAFWAYVASIVAFVPISIALSITVGNDQNPLTTSDGIRGVFSAASSGLLMAVLLGITMSAGEFRNNTATPTFLITPDRRRVMAAKVVAGGILGVVLAAVSAVLTVAVATPWLQARNVDINLLSADVITPVAGALLSLALGVIFGIGIGGLIPNQTIAITVIVVWSSIIETFLTGFVPEVGRWLPTGAASALGGTWTIEGGLLPFWAAALVLTGYSAATAAAGTHLITRKDMT